MPVLFTGWFWYLVTLLPVIGLIQIGDHDITDRYTYIPFIGLFLAFVWGGAYLATRWQLPSMAVCVFSCVSLGGMIIITSLQLRHWKNSVTLFSHALEVTDNNWFALNSLGKAYLDKGRVDDALWYFAEAVKAKPSYVIALINLGALYTVKNQPEQAVDVLRQAVRYDPDNPKISLLLQSLQAAGSGSAAELLQEMRSRAGAMPAK